MVDFEGLLGSMFEAMEECWCSPFFSTLLGMWFRVCSSLVELVLFFPVEVLQKKLGSG